MDFFDVVKLRRSVRSYTDREVETEKLERILECARLAPSWANKQCWSFIVVRDKAKIKALAKAAGMGNKWLAQAPIVIIACGDPGLSGTRGDMRYFTVDVAIAMEHLILGAADLGLGSCWIGAFNEAKTKEILEIPDEIRVVALTPIGYPAGKGGIEESITTLVAQGKNRKSRDEIIHHEEW